MRRQRPTQIARGHYNVTRFGVLAERLKTFAHVVTQAEPHGHGERVDTLRDHAHAAGVDGGAALERGGRARVDVGGSGDGVELIARPRGIHGELVAPSREVGEVARGRAIEVGE